MDEIIKYLEKRIEETKDVIRKREKLPNADYNAKLHFLDGQQFAFEEILDVLRVKGEC